MQEILLRLDWGHNPSEENAADLASSGYSGNILVKLTLWWSGPSWLTAPEATWPYMNVDVPELPEMSKTAQQLQISVTSNQFLEIKWYSNLQKLIRITAYILFFIKKLRKCNEENNHFHRILISEATEPFTFLRYRL